ncbi:hypothetical protein BDM02DRAFT_3112806 [Thelephora ganbajun]|uniref:Uncharacterized protein n=1 Tax=Thelephora ganbajun TaxID=370292 RepID=A0ACB6ZKD7_THEGA|nr:hypothetical protein BDM02DRAFT_3112806 [Thelephora ganbajun]
MTIEASQTTLDVGPVLVAGCIIGKTFTSVTSCGRVILRRTTRIVRYRCKKSSSCNSYKGGVEI